MVEKMQIQEKIYNIIKASPGHIIGFAKMHGLLDAKLQKYKYAISIGKRLDDLIIDSIANGPISEYNELYRETNAKLEMQLDRIGQVLETASIGYKTVKPTLQKNELDEEYENTLRTEFSHKFAATQAGIGWIGKTDLLISKEYGPRLRLSTILVENGDFEFKTGTPIIESECGNCTICVSNCPAQAANGKKWSIGTDRDEFYDAFKCREKCRELAKRNLQSDMSLCGICISVCPIGKKARERS
ncbi:MAG: epoxyqueuosine reductase [Chitinivibrionales bacterium]|nr:epoxyqueuosine reductase [Chitinivibrionales bacterium]MBD3356152.1 epoxyqueuosine reductase [Chitinivibrionales bacterium]